MLSLNVHHAIAAVCVNFFIYIFPDTVECSKLEFLFFPVFFPVTAKFYRDKTNPGDAALFWFVTVWKPNKLIIVSLKVGRKYCIFFLFIFNSQSRYRKKKKPSLSLCVSVLGCVFVFGWKCSGVVIEKPVYSLFWTQSGIHLKMENMTRNTERVLTLHSLSYTKETLFLRKQCNCEKNTMNLIFFTTKFDICAATLVTDNKTSLLFCCFLFCPTYYLNFFFFLVGQENLCR